MSLPSLRDDLPVSLDDLAQETDLRTLGIHHLDLLTLEAQYEVATLGGGQGVSAEPELKLILKKLPKNEKKKHFLFLLLRVLLFWIEQLPFVFLFSKLFSLQPPVLLTDEIWLRESGRDGAVFERKFPVHLNLSLLCLFLIWNKVALHCAADFFFRLRYWNEFELFLKICFKLFYTFFLFKSKDVVALRSGQSYVSKSNIYIVSSMIYIGEDQIDLRMNTPLSHRHLQSRELKLYNNLASSRGNFLTVIEAGLSNVERILSGLQCHSGSGAVGWKIMLIHDEWSCSGASEILTSRYEIHGQSVGFDDGSLWDQNLGYKMISILINIVLSFSPVSWPLSRNVGLFVQTLLVP